jgi:hypothetical protein
MTTPTLGLAQGMLKQHMLIQGVLGFVLVGVLVFFNVVEAMVLAPFASLFATMCVMILLRVRTAKRKTAA